MSNVDIFRDEYLPRIQAAKLAYPKWRERYPAELQKWQAYRDAVLAGNSPKAPALATALGKALVAAAKMGVADVAIFRDEFLSDAQAATIAYAEWKAKYPLEHEAWAVYSAGVLAGELPKPPVPSSRFGKALMAAGHMAERTDMNVTIVVPSSPLSGTVGVSATANPQNQVEQVQFLIDGVLKATDTSAPYTYSWNTTTVPDGNRVITVKAFYSRNKVETAQRSVQVKNSPTPPPPPPVQGVPVNTAVPTISDTTPTEGQTLTVAVGTWTNSPDSYTYQWLLDTTKTPIPGATGSSYTCSSTDVGKVLRCSVTARNSVGPGAAAESAATATVAALPASVPVLVTGGTPVISGVAKQGNVLSISNGSWTNSPTAYGHCWDRCDANGANCVDIPSQDCATEPTAGQNINATYVLTAADVGYTIKCYTTAYNATGRSDSVLSAATPVVTSATVPPPPPPPPPPSGTVLFYANFETIDILTQFQTSSHGYPNRVNTTTARGGVTPPRGQRMMFCDVVPGEYAGWNDPLLQSSAVQLGNPPAGTQNNNDVYTGFWMYIVPGFQSICDYNHVTFAEFHSSLGAGEQAPWHLGILGNGSPGQWYFDLHRASSGYSPVFQDTFGLASNDYGRWISFVIRTKWSSGTDGAAQCWKDGVLVSSHLNIATWPQYSTTVYPVVCVYRGSAASHSGSTLINPFGPGTVYFDEYRIGTTQAAVDPRNY